MVTFCIVLYCFVLYCIVLYCIVLYCIVCIVHDMFIVSLLPFLKLCSVTTCAACPFFFMNVILGNVHTKLGRSVRR